jgi:hypothetical protein
MGEACGEPPQGSELLPLPTVCLRGAEGRDVALDSDIGIEASGTVDQRREFEPGRAGRAVTPTVEDLAREGDACG